MAEVFWDVLGTSDEIAPGYDAAGQGNGASQLGQIYPLNRWDLCILDGKPLPGIARCKAKPQRKIDKKSKAGTDGSNPTVHGYDPGPVEIELTIWHPAQLAILGKLMDRYWPPLAKLFVKNKKTGKISGNVRPFKVYHPELDFLRIDEVLIQSVSTLLPGKVDGTKTITFYCLEFNRSLPKNVTSTPVAPKPTVIAERRALPAGTSGRSGTNYTPTNANQSLPGNTGSYTDPNTQDQS